jgi:hypothetical protein
MPRVVLPSELSRDSLVRIVARVQGILYLDMNREGREFWNPAKEWSGADVCDDIKDVLNEHGLVPEDEQDHCLPEDVASGQTAAEQLIVCLDGGLVEEVYSSLPGVQVIVVDWDVADAFPGDPKVLEVETQDRCIRGCVREAAVTPLDEAADTDLEALLVAAREQAFLPENPQLHAPQPAGGAQAGAAELTAWAQTQGLSPEDMDDAIHDRVETLGSRLNNEGLSAQIEFLVGQLGVEGTRSLMAELVTVKTS